MIFSLRAWLYASMSGPVAKLSVSAANRLRLLVATATCGMSAMRGAISMVAECEHGDAGLNLFKLA